MDIRKSLTIFLVGFLTIMSTMIIFTTQPKQAQAIQTIIKKSDLKLDLSLIQEADNFSQPKSILVTPIFTENSQEDSTINAEEWYKGLFYYFSSYRFNFFDLPAHYVIDPDGQIYQGVNGGVEREVTVKEYDGKPILIFYLASKEDTDFSVAAISTMEEFLLKLCNENTIKPEKISTSGMSLAIDPEEKLVNLESDKIYGSWEISIDKLKSRIGKEYAPIDKKYSIELLEYENPTNKVKIGDTVVLQMKIKNNSDYSLYEGGKSELLLTKKDGSDSKLFLNNNWVSKSQIALLPSGTVVRPGKEVLLEFKLKAPFEFGEYSEDFVIKNSSGQTFDETSITIKLDIDRGGLKVLEVLNTETGTLNVRQNPTTNSSSIGKASIGEKFIWSERSNNGWYKINFEDSQGWVHGKYVKEI